MLPPPLLIVDVSGYVFRAYHAPGVGDLRTRDGRPSGAIFGTMNMLVKLQRDFPTRQIVCVMDAPGKTFRHEIYPQYKANRPPAPPDLKVQFAPIREFLAATGWPLLSVSGVEADDVIATLTKREMRAERDVVVATADKDLMQLAGDGVLLYDGMKERRYDAAGVREKFGVTPHQIADYLALIGDSSDNIPGVAKVGPKTAVKWLISHQDLDSLIAAADSIAGVVGENLRDSIANGQLRLSRRLVELRDDMPANEVPENLTPQPPDKKTWRQLCEEWQFRRLSGAFDDAPATPAASPPSITAEKTAIEIITSETELSAWIDKIRAAKLFALAVETDGKPVMSASLVGLSLACGEQSAYLPLAHKNAETPQLPTETALRSLRPILEDAAVSKILHDGKIAWHVFANHGIVLAGLLDDIKIAAYVQDAAADNTLSALAATHLKLRTANFKDIVDGKKVKDFSEVAIAAAAAYAGENATVTWQLRAPLLNILSPAAVDIYTNLDRPLMPLLAAIERRGMRIDVPKLDDFSAAARADMAVLEERAHAAAGESFNLNSPKQLAEILFNKMGAPYLKKTGGGAQSTDEQTLAKLSALGYELAGIVLENRTLAKLVGTYAEKLPLLVSPQTGRVHTTFNQTAVITGRLSSSAPNLQNIPVRTDAGRKIRRAFVADDGFCLLSADYSQIELRLMAHIAADDALLSAFAAGADIHRQTAAETFGVAAACVSDAQRYAAKGINFGLIYGISAFGLARNIGVTQQQAKEHIDHYFARYPQVAAFMQKTKKEAPEKGFVETIFGRRIPLTQSRGGRPALERMAINAPIQGSAADLVKKAMLKVDEELRGAAMRSRIVLQVHDELLIESPTDEADELLGLLPQWMNGVLDSVPLEVSVRRGNNWDEAH